MSAPFVLGLGASSSASLADALSLCVSVLQEAGIGREEIAALATLDRRADHPALLALAAEFGLDLEGLSPPRLAEEESRLETPSAGVAARSGLAGIAEAAALCRAGPGARLLVPKRILGGVTAALAGGDA